MEEWKKSPLSNEHDPLKQYFSIIAEMLVFDSERASGLCVHSAILLLISKTTSLQQITVCMFQCSVLVGTLFSFSTSLSLPLEFPPSMFFITRSCSCSRWFQPTSDSHIAFEYANSHFWCLPWDTEPTPNKQKKREKGNLSMIYSWNTSLYVRIVYKDAIVPYDCSRVCVFFSCSRGVCYCWIGECLAHAFSSEKVLIIKRKSARNVFYLKNRVYSFCRS